jgi:hypothetical protein
MRERKEIDGAFDEAAADHFTPQAPSQVHNIDPVAALSPSVVKFHSFPGSISSISRCEIELAIINAAQRRRK